VTFGALLALCALRTGAAQCDLARIVPSDGDLDSQFGNVVAWQNDVIVVSQYLSDGGGEDAGSANVFRRNAGYWTQESRLAAFDAKARAHFGNSLAIDRDVIVVGAPWDSGIAGFGQGAAYVFRHSAGQWVQEAKLTSSVPQVEEFGEGVAIEGDTIAVGADAHAGSAGAGSGAVYVFARTPAGWEQQSVIIPSDVAAGDHFGLRLRLRDGRLYATANTADGSGGADQGAAYVFRLEAGQWVQEQKLMAADGKAADYLGAALDVAGDLLVVSAHGHDQGSKTDQGAAYVFRRTGTQWTQETELLASNGRANDWFGLGIAIDHGRVLIGAPYVTHVESSAGAVYVFRQQGTVWVQESETFNPDPVFDGNFGISIAGSGDGEAVIGARFNDGSAHEGGAAYVFAVSLDGPDCNGNGIPDPCDVAAGTSLDANHNGIPDDCERDQVLASSWFGNQALRYQASDAAFTGVLADLAAPQGMTYGPDGNLYVASENQNRVLRYDGRSGLFLDEFVSSDPGRNGGLDGPTGITFGPDGRLYVASFRTDAILRYDGVSGSFVSVFVPSGSGLLDGPETGLAFGPDGNLYVSSFFNDRVNRYDGVSGSFLGAFVPAHTGGLTGPRMLAFRSDGILLVSSWGSDQILRFDANGAFQGAFASAAGPTGLLWGGDRHLYVASDVTDSVSRFDGVTGNLIDVFVPPGSGGLDGAVFLAAMPDAALTTDRIQPGLAGQVNSIHIHGAAPMAPVVLLVGTAHGSVAPPPGCRGAFIGIADAFAFKLRADAQGEVSVSGFVPPAASGATVLVQTFEPQDCRVSNLVVHTFP
jgi:hypothetical protein